jgi:hypothetical protein
VPKTPPWTELLLQLKPLEAIPHFIW